MKRVLKWAGLVFAGFVVLLIVIAILFPAEDEDDSDQQVTSDLAPALTQENWHLAVAEARGERKALKGASVNLAGRVFNVIGRNSDETQVQIYADPDESEQSTLVVIPWDQEVRERQYLIVQGKLSAYHRSQNLFGGEVSVPVIEAESVEVTDRFAAFPASVVINLDGIQIQNGLSIVVERIELTPKETRVFIRAQNESTESARLYAFQDDPIIVQGTKQIKSKNLFGENLPEHDDTLLPGTATQGVILFEALNLDEREARIVWGRPRTEDFRVEFEDWIWNFSW